jgi:hypothetical protein
MALHERTYSASRRPYGVVFFNSTGRYAQEDMRVMIEDAAKRLGISRIVWLEA